MNGAERGAIDTERLHAVLGTPALSRLVGRLRERLARDRDLARSLRIADPSETERRAIEALLGRSPGRGVSLTVPLARLDETLRAAQIAPGLIAALEALGGPLVDPRAAAAEASDAWQAALAPTRRWIASEVNPQRRAGLEAWLAALEAEGLLKRLVDAPDEAPDEAPEQARGLLEHAHAVLRRLPASRGSTLAELAASATGDAHGLDPGRPLCALVQRAIAALESASSDGAAIEAIAPDAPDDELRAVESAVEGDAAARRRLWEGVGISVDALGSSALVFGLRADGAGLVDRLLDLHAEAGEPCRLTEQQLLHHPPRFDAATVQPVFVCENPAVVAAASRELGANSLRGALICSEGQPSTAVRLLLDALQRAGAAIHAHADFDAAGLQIVALLAERHGALPWRFDSAHYLTAVAGANDAGLAPSLPAPGNPRRLQQRYDDPLAATLLATGAAIHEELVVDELLADLAHLDANGLESGKEPDREVTPALHARLERRCPRAAWLAPNHPEAATLRVKPQVAELFAQHRRTVVRRYRELAGPDAPGLLTRIRAARHLDREVELEALAAQWLEAHAARETVRGARLVYVGPDCPLASDPFARAGLIVEDVTDAVRHRAPRVAARRQALRSLLARATEPAVPIGPWCRHRDRREACPFVERCFESADVPRPSVLDLPRGGQRCWALYRSGHVALEALDDTQLAELSPTQRRLARAAREDRLVVDRETLREQLARWPRPWSFVDLETFNPPLSALADIPPFGHIPFAAAVCHDDDAAPETIVSSAQDPRPELVDWLVERLGSRCVDDSCGSLIAYNAPFEAARLSELARACPERSETLLALRERLVDARAAVEASVAHPRFGGRFDLKTVCGTLLGEQRDTAIADGLAAQAIYARLRDGDGTADASKRRSTLARYVADDVAQLRVLCRWLATQQR